MIISGDRREAAMPAKRWPTIEEVVERARQGLLDETTVTVPPTAEDRARIDAELKAFGERPRSSVPAPRVARKRRPA
jgi:hypothetical protein